MTLPMMPSATTIPAGETDAQRFYDSVFVKTGSRDQAIKATTQRFGPPDVSAPPAPPIDATGQTGMSQPSLPLGEGLLNMGRQFVQSASGGLADEAAGVLSSDPLARAKWLAKLKEGRSLDPTESAIASGLGMVVPAKATGALIGGTANALTRLTGLSPRVAGWIASLTAGGATGAGLGMANAEPGRRMEHVGRDALLGMGTAAAVDILAATGPILKKFTGYLTLSKPARQRLTDALVLDELAATNQSVAQALDRAEQLTQLGSNPTVGEALGPAAARVARRSGPLRPPEQGVAFAESQSLTGSVEGIKERIAALESALGGTASVGQRGATKGQLSWRAEQFPNAKRAMEIATKDMGLNIQEATQTVALAKELVQTRNELGAALMGLSKRDPVGAKQLLEDVFAGRRIVGGVLGRTLGAVIGPAARASEIAMAKTTLETLVGHNPMQYLGELKQLQSIQAQAGAAARAARGAFAGQIPGTAGTVYRDRQP